MSIELNGSTGIDFNDGSNQSTAATPYARKNLIINGDMQIAQRGTSSTGITTAAYYTVDRFTASVVSAGTWTMSQDTDVPSGQGFSTSLKMQCTTANGSLGASAILGVNQVIEAQNLQHLKYGTSNAESLTLSFWVKSNKTGTYVAWFYQHDDVRHTSKTFTIDVADTWEKKTITISGDTTGVIDNNNGQGISVRIITGSGTDYTSGTSPDGTWEAYTAANIAAGLTVNLADNTANYINITGCQLEVNDSASDFEFVPYDMELVRCQRYYWKIAGFDYPAIASGVCSTTTNARVYVNYPVEMRTYPTISYSGTVQIYVVGNHTVTAIAGAYEGLNTTMLDLTTSGLTAGRGCVVYLNNASTNYIQANAEL